jgi:hypothetical protein
MTFKVHCSEEDPESEIGPGSGSIYPSRLQNPPGLNPPLLNLLNPPPHKTGFQARLDNEGFTRRCRAQREELPKPSPTSKKAKVSNVSDGTAKSVRNSVVTKMDSNVTFSPKPMCVKCPSSVRTPIVISPTILDSSWATFCSYYGQRMARNGSKQIISTRVSISVTRTIFT